MNEIEQDLSSNLRKRLATLQQDQEERDVTQLQASLAAKRTELQTIDGNVTRVKVCGWRKCFCVHRWCFMIVPAPWAVLTA
jgi:hypothetical protein